MLKHVSIILFCVLLTVLSAESTYAEADQNISELSFNSAHSKWSAALNAAEEQIKMGSLDAEQANGLRRQISIVRDAALNKNQDASEQSEELKKLLDALGSLPQEGEPEEAYEVARERRDLTQQLRTINGQFKQSDLINERSEILLREISTLEISQIVSNLTHQDPLPLDPRVWIKAGSQFFHGYQQLVSARKEGGYQSPFLTVIPLLTVCALLAFLMGLWTRKGLLSRFRRSSEIDAPSYRKKVIAALGVGTSRGLIPVVCLFTLCGIAWNYWLKDALDPQFVWPRGLFFAVVFYLIGTAIVRATFSPRLPQWNLTWVTYESAKKIAYWLNLLVAIIAVGIVFDAVLTDTGIAPEFGSIDAFVKNSIISIILLFLTRKHLWQMPADLTEKSSDKESQTESANLWFWPYLRLITGMMALAALICSILGFHNLADFLLPRTIIAGLLAALLVTLRVLVREAFSLLLEKESSFASSLRGSLAFNQETGQRVNFWLMTLFDLLAILFACYLLLILWKFPHQDIMHWFSSWFTGISIGSYSFSLADVLLAFLVLFGVVALTRVIRSVLENRLLPQTRMDIGVRTAISSGVGYVGVLIAILLALSTLGIDLTKLALIAGALSVGIGFGLQNIVNNFVSGLVLLFERPIKIGDWVVLGDLEGMVKQINVRSTEIETFSRASVIIPNSDLLQTAVVNWTHKSAFGRLEVPIGVGYNSDIDQVEAILLECAQERADILSWPAPFVYFLGFGESSLDFQLYVYIDNVERRLRVGSDLRKSILTKFRAAGVEIPFPQRVVTLNNQDSSSIDQLTDETLSNPELKL